MKLTFTFSTLFTFAIAIPGGKSIPTHEIRKVLNPLKQHGTCDGSVGIWGLQPELRLCDWMLL